MRVFSPRDDTERAFAETLRSNWISIEIERWGPQRSMTISGAETGISEELLAEIRDDNGRITVEFRLLDKVYDAELDRLVGEARALIKKHGATGKVLGNIIPQTRYREVTAGLATILAEWEATKDSWDLVAMVESRRSALDHLCATIETHTDGALAAKVREKVDRRMPTPEDLEAGTIRLTPRLLGVDQDTSGIPADIAAAIAQGEAQHLRAVASQLPSSLAADAMRAIEAVLQQENWDKPHARSVRVAHERAERLLELNCLSTQLADHDFFTDVAQALMAFGTPAGPSRAAFQVMREQVAEVRAGVPVERVLEACSPDSPGSAATPAVE